MSSIGSKAPRSAVSVVLLASAALTGCPTPQPRDGGDSGDASSADVTELPGDFFPAPAPAFTATTNAPLSVQVSASGEALAQQGYDYAAAPAEGEPVFVDGWEVRFERYLVVVDRVRLTRPGADPSMREVLGDTVAEHRGPFVVNVQRLGAITGAGGAPETAAPLFAFAAPDAGGAFDPTARYALSYEVVPASFGVRNANLVESDGAALFEMVSRGWTTFFAGTAIYRGRAASATVDPSFERYPTRVSFRFGFSAPTAYLNCHNPELGAEDTPANRGIQPDASRAVRAQLTFHSDHFFWDQANAEGTPLHFDPLAARAQSVGGNMLVTLDDLAGVNPASLVDRMNSPVMDRGAQTTGYAGSGRLAYQINGAAGVSDLRDFVVYNHRANGHLNSDGLCFVRPTGPVTF